MNIRLSSLAFLSVLLVYFASATPCPYRCGKDWTDAANKCGQCCTAPADCTEDPLDTNCYAGLTQDPCDTQPTAPTTAAPAPTTKAPSSAAPTAPTTTTKTPTSAAPTTAVPTAPTVSPPTPPPNDALLPNPADYRISTLSGCGTGKRVSLTFDDGPAEFGETEGVLATLAEYGIKATFYVSPAAWGDHQPALDARCALLSQIVAAGHEVQSHSWSHPDFSDGIPVLSFADIDYQLSMTAEWIIACGGTAPTIFRPPFGHLSTEQAQYIVDLGYVISLWNLDSKDYWQPNNAQWTVSQLVLDEYDPAITSINLLMHDRTTYLILDAILDKFIDAGYEFISQSECWADCDTRDAEGVCMDETVSEIDPNWFPHNQQCLSYLWPDTWRYP